MKDMQKITYEKFENIIETLRKDVRDYYARYCHEKQIEIYLANGDRIFYAIPETAIAHLLGIDTNYLLSKSIFTVNNKSSIEVLKQLCAEENTYRLYQLISQGHLSFENIFSEYFNEKLESFDKVIQPNIFEMEFICKIDKEKCHANGIDTIPVEYLLCSKDNNDNYLLLGIGKEKNRYVGITSQTFTDLQSLQEKWGKVIENQEMTLASKLIIKHIYDEYKTINATLPYLDRIEVVRELETYKKQFNCSYNICYDYILLAKQNNQNYNNINQIVSWMETKHPITEDMLMGLPYLGNNLRKVADFYNNSLFAADTNAETEYSELAKNNKELLDELNALKKEVLELKTKNIELENNNEKLSIERDTYKDSLEGIVKSAQKVLKPIE